MSIWCYQRGRLNNQGSLWPISEDKISNLLIYGDSASSLEYSSPVSGSSFTSSVHICKLPNLWLVLCVALTLVRCLLIICKATGGGAFKYADVFKERLAVTFDKEDEMDCLVAGANFLLRVGPLVTFSKLFLARKQILVSLPIRCGNSPYVTQTVKSSQVLTGYNVLILFLESWCSCVAGGVTMVTAWACSEKHPSLWKFRFPEVWKMQSVQNWGNRTASVRKRELHRRS